MSNVETITPRRTAKIEEAAAIAAKQRAAAESERAGELGEGKE